MTKEKMFLVISFLLQSVIGLIIYAQRQDLVSIRREMALTREILQIQIDYIRPNKAVYIDDK